MEKIKETIKTKYKWIIFAIVLIIFLAIAEDVFEKEIFEFDGAIYSFLVSHRNSVLNTFFKGITQLGSGIVLVPLTILCMIFIKNKKYKIMMPINIFLVVGMNWLLKHFFVRPRPNELRLIEETGYSFPSGHAMASTAFYGLLIYIVYKEIKNKKIRNTICILLAILISLIDISRIYVGVHYTSDVLGGTCLSIAYLIVFTQIAKMIDSKKEEKRKEAA